MSSTVPISVPAANDEAAILALLQQIGDGWSRGDAAAFAAPFAEDADYIMVTGDRVRGRQQIAESHQRVFDGMFRGSRLGGQLQHMKSVSPDVVLVQSLGGIVFAGENDSAVKPTGIVTMVVAKQAGSWRVVSFQNTPVGRPRKLRFLFRLLASRLRKTR